MREEFLHYIWQFQKYSGANLLTADGRRLQIIKVGQRNHHAGPDFSMAEIRIGETHWIGHVEIHIKSSDWLQHGHQNDPNYDSVILHVVWEHNQEIELGNGGKLPVLELKDRVAVVLLARYEGLLGSLGKFIPCENEIVEVPELIWDKWMERLFLERLEMRCAQLKEWLEETHYHWEAVAFYALAKVFGMKVNSEAFLSVVRSVDFKILQKCKSHPVVLEALFMGQAGFLEEGLSDAYYQSLQATYRYLVLKFKLEPPLVIRPQFFRLRPNNFPTIRLSQLAAVWSAIPNFVSALLSIKTKEQAYAAFSSSASRYWNTHYRFGKESESFSKKLSKPFIDLILINVVLPFQFLYGMRQGTTSWDDLESIFKELPMEKNMIVSRYQSLRDFDENAWNGQALIQLNQSYCQARKCIHCMIGNHLLKS